MYDHRSHGDLLRGAAYPVKGVVEQRRAESFALTALVDRKAGEDRAWDRKVPREALRAASVASACSSCPATSV